MKPDAIIRGCGVYARECVTSFLFAVILVITGCSSAGHQYRAELAPPPPPFVTAGQSFGPPVPVEIAMLRMVRNIEPAAGPDEPATLSLLNPRCPVKRGFSDSDNQLGFGFGEREAYDSELSFARLHSPHDSAEMTVRYTMALTSSRTPGCR